MATRKQQNGKKVKGNSSRNPKSSSTVDRDEELFISLSQELGTDYGEAAVKVAKERTPRKKKEKKKKKKKKNEEGLGLVEKRAIRNLKLVMMKTMEKDIRMARVPANCSLMELKEEVCNRFPGSGPVLIKYKDEEGDLITITTDEELRFAEACSSKQGGSFRLYLVEINPMIAERLERKGVHYIDPWIVEFAKMFKDHVVLSGANDLGVKVYSEAIEEAVTSDEAQVLLNEAAESFQEMAALALFSWGNVHMSRASKRIKFGDDASMAFERAKNEYVKAGERYGEALRIKPDFYEGLLALGQQQFERARLDWYYAVSCDVDLSSWSSAEVMELYNDAEDNVDRGMEMWEAAHLFKDMSQEDAADARINDLRSQMNILRGSMLYERSMMEYRLGVPVWQERLELALEKFQMAGASAADVGVMMKNHISNGGSMDDGLGFRIDEIVHAWNDMNEAKKWQSRVHSFRLEPLLRRRVSKIYRTLEVS